MYQEGIFIMCCSLARNTQGTWSQWFDQLSIGWSLGTAISTIFISFINICAYILDFLFLCTVEQPWMRLTDKKITTFIIRQVVTSITGDSGWVICCYSVSHIMVSVVSIPDSLRVWSSSMYDVREQIFSTNLCHFSCAISELPVVC